MLNRRVGRMELFEKPSDYKAFEQVLVGEEKGSGVILDFDVTGI